MDAATNRTSAAGTATADSGLGCLLMMLGFLRINAEAGQLVHARGRGNEPFSLADMQRAAQRLGVKAKSRKVALDKLPGLPTPCILATRSGFLLLGKAVRRDDRLQLLVQAPDAQQPHILDEASFAQIYTGEVLLMTTREGLVGKSRRFDISWFIPVLVKYRKPLRDVVLASFFIQLVGLLSPLFFQVVIDKVLFHQTFTTLYVLVTALVVSSIWEVLLQGLRTWLFAHTSNRVDAELGSQLFRHLMALPLSYFEARRVGDSVARVRELDQIREFLTNNSITLLIDLFFTSVFLVVMLLYSPLLTLIVVLSMIGYVLVSLLFTTPLRQQLDEKFNRGADNQAFLVEAVTGVGTLKAMSVEPILQDRWERKLASYISVGFKVTQLANWGSNLIQLISKLATALVLFIGAREVIEGRMSVGALVAFNMFAGRVASPVLRLAQMWQDFQRVRISVERLGDILNTTAELGPSGGQSQLGRIEGSVRFEDISFRYRPDLPMVLNKVRLAIKPGEIIGIVGPSGSGKSTLTKLIQRLYPPSAGKVLIDGQDIAVVPPEWLRRQVGVVLQENMLFNMSIRHNIALADPTLPIEQVMAAAKLAGAHEFITRMAMGYDSIIEERGSNLSGGQRQRLAIARALITDPRILILDEATSALDAESEAIIQDNLKAMAKGRTVIIIAHRLSAVRLADRIVGMEDGEIVEIGTHDELLEARGVYERLYRKQMGGQP